MRANRLSDDRNAVQVVGLAIARVIARKTVNEDGRLEKLDGLSRITATEELAREIVASIGDEAQAAVYALESYVAEIAKLAAQSLTPANLASTAQSAFEDACGDDPSPYEVGLAWRKAGESLHELLVEAAEEVQVEASG